MVKMLEHMAHSLLMLLLQKLLTKVAKKLASAPVLWASTISVMAITMIRKRMRMEIRLLLMTMVTNLAMMKQAIKPMPLQTSWMI